VGGTAGLYLLQYVRAAARKIKPVQMLIALPRQQQSSPRHGSPVQFPWARLISARIPSKQNPDARRTKPTRADIYFRSLDMARCLVKRQRHVQLVSGGYAADLIMHANLSAAP